MTQMPINSDPAEPSQQLDGDFSPAGSAGHNSDSVSAYGREVGEAHDDDIASHVISADTMRRASEATRPVRD